jgi:DNA-binding response OmpR family regulator
MRHDGPTKTSCPREEAALHDPPAIPSQPVVLVVDDDPDIGAVLTSLFRRADVRAVTTGDGEAALMLLGDLLPDLVVLDVGLPGMDGLEVLDQIRRNPDTRDVRVLLLSARAFEAERSAGLARGADEYVTKPFDNRALIERCLDLIEHGRKNPDR